MLDKDYYLQMPLLLNVMPWRYAHLPNVLLDCSGLPNLCHPDNTEIAEIGQDIRLPYEDSNSRVNVHGSYGHRDLVNLPSDAQ